MRLASMLTLTALAAAGTANASPEDRYGPATDSPPARTSDAPRQAVVVPVTYSGPFLRWPGKRSAIAVTPPPAAFASPAAAPAPTPSPRAPVPAVATPSPVAVYAPPPLPVNALSTRRAAPIAHVPALPAPAIAQRRPTAPRAPAPATPAAWSSARRNDPASVAVPAAIRRQTVQPAPAAPAQIASAAPVGAAPVRVRYYSLHSEYGDTPDRISVPQSRPPVLIGPPDGAGSNSIGDDPAAQAATARSRSNADSPPL
jgi:hypothetical protein